MQTQLHTIFQKLDELNKIMEKLKDIGISQELFEEWRKPRFGEANPTLTSNPVWNWLIETKINAWQAKKASEHDYYDDGATWCFDRFGQTNTQLPDGRIVYIGGEHEDHYDPDFYIYNDVVVENIDKSLDIYTYPEDVFLPTDFHSSTLVGNKIIIVGRLGYPEQRETNTPVYTLDINTFTIEKIPTTGIMPGWIFRHIAILMEDKKTLLITLGENYRGDNKSICENINEWTLNTETWEWQLAKENLWDRWEYLRKDRGRNFLWEMRSTLWTQKVNWLKEFEEHLTDLNKKLGYDPDISKVESLYQPPVNFTSVPEIEDEYNQYRIIIDNVIIRYVEDSWGIQVCAEGTLAPEIIETLKNDLFIKLTGLIKTDWEILDI